MQASSQGAIALRVEDANKVFPARGGSSEVVALKDVSLEMKQGEFTTIVGPSGCGKSTLLSAVAGLTTLSSGNISVAGVSINGSGSDRGVVFQHASLLPWRTVIGNISYGIEMQRSPKREERESRVEWALDLVGLGEARNRYPNELSGGMQQRVNLARALATKPDMLLMDEPFGALDAMTKARLQLEVGRISAETGVSVLFVTHDIDEALMLADRVVVMAGGPGRIVKIVDVPGARPRGADFAESTEFAKLRRELRLSIENGPSGSADQILARAAV